MIESDGMVYDLTIVPQNHVRIIGGRPCFIDTHNMINLREVGKFCDRVKGCSSRDSDLVSVFIPPGYSRGDAIRHLDEEKVKASEITSPRERDNTLGCIDRVLGHLKSIRHWEIPRKGLIIYASNHPGHRGVLGESMVGSRESPIPLTEWSFKRDRRFDTENFEKDTILVHHFLNTMELFHRYLPWESNAVPWNPMRDAIIEEAKKAGSALTRYLGFRHLVDYYTNVFDRVKRESINTGDEQHNLHNRRYWQKVAGEAIEQRRGETPDEELIHDSIIAITSQRSDIFTEDVSRKIVEDVVYGKSGLLNHGRFEYRVEAGPIMRGKETHQVRVLDRQEMSPEDPNAGTKSIYLLIPVENMSEIDNMNAASLNSIGPRVVHTDERNLRVLIECPRNSIIYAGRSLTSEQCATVGEKTAEILARAIRRNIEPPADYDRNLFIHYNEASGAIDLRFSECAIHPPSDAYLFSGNTDLIKRHIEEVAKSFRHSLTDPHIAWRVFTTAMPAAAREGTERERLTGLISDTENRLAGIHKRREQRTPEELEWEEFFDSSRMAMCVKDTPRRTHLDYLDYLRQHPPETKYPIENLDSLRALEPLIAKTIVTLMVRGYGPRPQTEEAYIEDVISDVGHVHVCIPYSDENLAKAKVGSIGEIKEGALVFDLHEYELGHKEKRRYDSIIGQRVLVRFKDGIIRAPEVIPDTADISEYGLLDLAGFRAYLDLGDKYHARNQNFGIWWNQDYFGELSADERKRGIGELKRETELESLWERARYVTIENYTDWKNIMDQCARIRDTLSNEDRERFIRGLSDVLDPTNGRLFDRSDEEPFARFSFYQLPGMSEVLDKTIDTSYSELNRYVSDLFTLLPEAGFIRTFTKSYGRYPTPEDIEAAKSRGEIKEVRLAGEKPSDYIKNIEFQRNGRHYVVKITFALEDGTTQEAIVKHSETMWDEYYMSNYIREASAGEVDTPFILPHIGYGVENVAPGRRFHDNRDIVSRYTSPVAYWLGKHYSLAGLDMSERNAMIDEAGNMTRIDLEILDRLARSPGIHGTLFELTTMENTMPSWKDIRERQGLFGLFADGVYDMNATMDQRYPDGASPYYIGRSVLHLGADDKRTSEFFTQEYVSQFLQMAEMGPEEKVRELLFWRSREEEKRILAYLNETPDHVHDIDPLWHLNYVNRVSRKISPDRPIDVSTLIEERLLPYMALGMYSRIAGIGLETDTVRYVDFRDRPIQADTESLPYYVAGRELTLLRAYTKHLSESVSNIARAGSKPIGTGEDLRRMCEKYGIDMSNSGFRRWGPHDTAGNMKSEEARRLTETERIEIARRILLLRDRPVEIPEDLRERYEPLCQEADAVRAFTRGFKIADAWLKSNRDAVLDYVKIINPESAEGVGRVIDMDLDVLLQRTQVWAREGGIGNEILPRESSRHITPELESMMVPVFVPLKEYRHSIPRTVIDSARYIGIDVNRPASKYDRVMSISEEIGGDLTTKVDTILDSIQRARLSAEIKYNSTIGVLEILDIAQEKGILPQIADVLSTEASKPISERTYVEPITARRGGTHDTLIDTIELLRGLEDRLKEAIS